MLVLDLETARPLDEFQWLITPVREKLIFLNVLIT